MSTEISLPTRQTFESAANRLEGKEAAPASKAQEGANTFGSFLDKLLGAGKSAEDSGKKVEKVGKAFIDFGNGLQEVDLSALEKGSSDMTQVFKNVERSSENFLKATEASNDKAEKALRNSEAALRRAYQMSSKGKK